MSPGSPWYLPSPCGLTLRSTVPRRRGTDARGACWSGCGAAVVAVVVVVVGGYWRSYWRCLQLAYSCAFVSMETVNMEWSHDMYITYWAWYNYIALMVRNGIVSPSGVCLYRPIWSYLFMVQKVRLEIKPVMFCHVYDRFYAHRREWTEGFYYTHPDHSSPEAIDSHQL